MLNPTDESKKLYDQALAMAHNIKRLKKQSNKVAQARLLIAQWRRMLRAGTGSE